MPKLKVVDRDAVVVVTPRSVEEAVDGSRRDLLVAMRAQLASDLTSGVPAHALAALSRQLLEIDREIRLLDKAAEKDDIGHAAETPDSAWEAV